MKKISKLLALVLVIALALSAASCSTFGKVNKALEGLGYTEMQGEDAEKQAKDYEDETVSEVHVFSKGGLLGGVVIVFEFKATDDLVEYYKSSETLQGVAKDVSSNEDVKATYNALCDAGVACGNCLVLPLTITELSNVLNAIKDLNK